MKNLSGYVLTYKGEPELHRDRGCEEIRVLVKGEMGIPSVPGYDSAQVNILPTETFKKVVEQLQLVKAYMGTSAECLGWRKEINELLKEL